MTPPTVLVTGASGFIGRVVCAHLLGKGYRIRAFVRKTSRWEMPAHPLLEKAAGDMRDAASLKRASAGADWAVHLAAAKADEPDSAQTNVEGAKNLIAACRACGVKFIINISTQAVKLRQKGTYALTKEAADRVFESSGFPYTTLRPSLVYGDFAGGIFASLVRYSRFPVVPVLGPGTAPHWPIHVEDLARAIETAALRPSARGRTYDAGGPDKADLNGLLRNILQRQGRRRVFVHVPVWLGFLLARLFSVLPHPPFTRSNVLGSNEHVDMDVNSFFRDLGFTPRTLAQGLDELFGDAAEREASLLLAYVLSASGISRAPGADERKRYARAVAAQIPAPHGLDPVVHDHPVLLGGLDAVTKLFYPRSLLQKKLVVAAALAECHPSSAPWLLPRDRTLTGLFFKPVRLLLRALAKLFLGLAFLPFPGFVRRNAGPV